MNTHFSFVRSTSLVLVLRPFAPSGLLVSWMMGIAASWKRFTYRRALQRLEHLNNHALRDVGLWREPESRVDEWWMMNPAAVSSRRLREIKFP